MAETVERFGFKVDFEEELGRGAFGTVYKGVGADGEEVAMKKVSKINKTNASREEVRYHYMKEKIDHDNIVKVYDVKTWKDSMWIIMELCDVGDLNDFFRGNRDKVTTDEFREDNVLGVMKDVARGLAFLHGKDIVHRDIKPGNILMKTSAAAKTGFTAKLGDFGLSKILDPEDMTSAMSSDVGTMAFKAPEFWDGNPGQKVHYHRNVDVYAAGLTFAAMLQAQPGRNLNPRAQYELKPTETNMAIGLIAFTRQADVNLENKNLQDLLLSELIQEMTRTSPTARINAEEVLRLISQREQSLAGNQMLLQLRHLQLQQEELRKPQGQQQKIPPGELLKQLMELADTALEIGDKIRELKYNPQEQNYNPQELEDRLQELKDSRKELEDKLQEIMDKLDHLQEQMDNIQEQKEVIKEVMGKIQEFVASSREQLQT